MKVTIVGGGKVGYYLVKTLLSHGYEPTIIEIDKKVCSQIANELDIPVICGDGTSLDALKEAEVGRSSVVVAVSGQDEDNLVVCQIAKKIFDVPKTIVRVNNPKNADVMKKLGVDNVISGTDRIAELFEREVDTSKIKQVLSLNHGIGSIAEINIPEDYKQDGIKLSELKLPENINIISIERDQKLIIPRGNIALNSKDKLLVISNNITLPKIQSIFKIKN